MKNPEGQVLAWDWAIRVFHWLFALSVGGALVVAMWIDHDSDFFRIHMLLGICAGFLLLLRVILALVGTQPIRLSAALESIVRLPRYLGSLFRYASKPETGHNPLAWLVYLLMFAVVLALVLTGVFMWNDRIEAIHEILGWVMLGLLGAHLLGMVIHTLRFCENIAAAMLTGRKRGSVESSLEGSQPLAGLLVLVVSMLFVIQLFRNYEPGASEVRLPWIGLMVPLGAAEEDTFQMEAHEYEHEQEYEHEHKYEIED